MRILLAITGLALFLGVLLITTLRSTSTPLEQSVADREIVQDVCRRSVRIQAPDARFPFDANVEAKAAGELRLSGSVDLGPESQPIRRNYECVMRLDRPGEYVTDSVVVWQSH